MGIFVLYYLTWWPQPWGFLGLLTLHEEPPHCVDGIITTDAMSPCCAVLVWGCVCVCDGSNVETKTPGS